MKIWSSTYQIYEGMLIKMLIYHNCLLNILKVSMKDICAGIIAHN